MTMYLISFLLAMRLMGVQAAANTYFGGDVSELNLAECRCWPAYPTGPSYYGSPTSI